MLCKLNNVQAICATIAVILVTLILSGVAVVGCTQVEETNRYQIELEIEQIKLEQMKIEKADK